MKKLLITLSIISLSIGQAFAFSSPPPAPPANAPIDPMFNTFVSLGDSLTHGFMSGSVDETRQPDTYGKRLAGLMKTDYVQGLLRFPGFLVNIEDVGKGNIRWWEYYYAIIGGKRKDNYLNQSKLNNFAITGADVSTVLESGGSEGGYYKLVLGKNGAPALDQALNRNPSFMSVWIGNNDSLGCALWTDVSKLTPVSKFQSKFAQLVSRITSKSSVQGVVLVNCPDVAAIPYLQPANDPDVPAGSMKAFWNTNVSDVDEVLTPADIAAIQARSAQFNSIIQNYAAANGWALFDVDDFFNEVVAYGYVLKNKYGHPTGRMMDAGYLGGIFSLDGVHITSTGHAVVTNYIAREINNTYGTNLGRIDEYAASENDTLYKAPYDPRGIINSWIGQAIQWVIELFI